MKADWSVPCSGTSTPRFEEIATRFGVTIFTEHVSRLWLDETDQAIANAFAGGEGLMTSQIATIIGLTPNPPQDLPLALESSFGRCLLGCHPDLETLGSGDLTGQQNLARKMGYVRLTSIGLESVE